MLTESEIDAMNPGVNIDALVHKEIFGFLVVESGLVYIANGGPIPGYSSTWEGMGLVVDKIIEENWWTDAAGDFFLENWQDDEWVCCNRAPGDRKERYSFIPVFYAVGKTPMEAVAKAALKAKLGLKAP